MELNTVQLIDITKSSVAQSHSPLKWMTYWKLGEVQLLVSPYTCRGICHIHGCPSSLEKPCFGVETAKLRNQSSSSQPALLLGHKHATRSCHSDMPAWYCGQGAMSGTGSAGRSLCSALSLCKEVAAVWQCWFSSGCKTHLLMQVRSWWTRLWVRGHERGSINGGDLASGQFLVWLWALPRMLTSNL